MTGTLSSIPLSQNVDENGLPLSGARLFLYQANTSTPIIAYKDFALSVGQEHSFPIVANALGRLPMFWMADGFYRARLEDRYGTIIFDEPYMAALSTAAGGGGGGVVENPAFQTGDWLWQPIQGGRTGWVRANARTIGNALSGATERANADTAALFSVLWANFTNERCPVPGGRGASAAADYAGNKQIGTPDMRGIVGGMGVDGMGNALSGRFSLVPLISAGVTVDSVGALVGGNAHLLLEAEMPTHNHTLADPGHTHVLTDPGHTHPYAGRVSAGSVSGGAGFPHSVDAPLTTGLGPTGITMAAQMTGITAAPKGGGVGHNNVPYATLGTWYIRL